MLSTLMVTSTAPEAPPAVVRSEDWLTVGLAAVAIGLVLIGVRPAMPVVRWTDSLGPVLTATNLLRVVTLGAGYLVLSAIGVWLLGGNVAAFASGFPFVFAIGWIS